jgi:hypothetical protein
MEMILADEFGIALVLEDERPPATTQEPVRVELYMGYAEDNYGSGTLVSTALVGQDFVLEHNPDFDRDLRIYLVSIAEDGSRSVSQLSDAPSKFVPIRRETEAPAIGLVEDAEDPNLLVLGVGGFTPYARLRKVEVADNPEMEDAQVTIYQGHGFPPYVNITRESGTDNQTVYVRVSHSSGGEYAPASEVLELIFADASGAGGSSGGFDPINPDHFELELP